MTESRAAPLRILAIAGSLRRASWNRKLLEACVGLAAPLDIEVYRDLGSVPLFDEDLEADTDGGPAPVKQLRDLLARADGLLLSTPEYNQSIPGVLKNTIDWLSRTDVLAGKPAAIIGTTPGRWGTRLSQHALRQTLASTGTPVMPAPMLFVGEAHKLFDDGGTLIDERTRKALHGVLGAFATWIDRSR